MANVESAEQRTDHLRCLLEITEMVKMNSTMKLPPIDSFIKNNSNSNIIDNETTSSLMDIWTTNCHQNHITNSSKIELIRHIFGIIL